MELEIASIFGEVKVKVEHLKTIHLLSIQMKFTQTKKQIIPIGCMKFIEVIQVLKFCIWQLKNVPNGN